MYCLNNDKKDTNFQEGEENLSMCKTYKVLSTYNNFGFVYKDHNGVLNIIDHLDSGHEPHPVFNSRKTPVNDFCVVTFEGTKSAVFATFKTGVSLYCLETCERAETHLHRYGRRQRALRTGTEKTVVIIKKIYTSPALPEAFVYLNISLVLTLARFGWLQIRANPYLIYGLERTQKSFILIFVFAANIQSPKN